MGPTDLATNTFGQTFNATMIQMISGFRSLINGGYYYEPHMVSEIISPSGATEQIDSNKLPHQTSARRVFVAVVLLHVLSVVKSH